MPFPDRFDDADGDDVDGDEPDDADAVLSAAPEAGKALTIGVMNSLTYALDCTSPGQKQCSMFNTRPCGTVRANVGKQVEWNEGLSMAGTFG